MTRAFPLVLLALASCNRPYRNAVARAESAESKGDRVTAVFAWRDACRLSRGAACTRADAIEREVVESSISEARPACEAGDMLGCSIALRPANEVAPVNPTPLALMERAGQAWADRCASMPLSDPSQAVAIVRCLESARRWATPPGYEKRALRERARAAAVFRTLAAAPEMAVPAAAFPLLASAACLAPDAEVVAARDQARTRFFEAATMPVLLEVAGPAASPAVRAACQGSRLPPAAWCGAGGPAVTPLSVRLELSATAPAYSVSEEAKSLQFRSGTRSVPNPAREDVDRRLEAARRSFEEIESQARLGRADCESLKTDQACARFKELRKLHDERAEAYNLAAREAQGVPRNVNEDVLSSFPYAIRHHRWDVRFAARWTVRGEGPESVFEEPGALSFVDTEHPGFAPANIAADPRVDPPADWVEKKLAERVAQKLSELADVELKQRASAHLNLCGPSEPLTPGWLRCWAEASLWQGTEPSGGALISALASLADARRGGERAALPSCL